ncbi:MAG: hypothetical protein ACRDTX_16560 [Pseudonocardiaceae bacterium]
MASRAGLRLRWADALNLLSRIERVAGDTKTAAQAAHEAYLQASCDGPPFSYAAGLDEALANLSAVGAPEPDALRRFTLDEPFPEVFFEPSPPDVSLVWLHSSEAPARQVIDMIEKLRWVAVDATATQRSWTQFLTLTWPYPSGWQRCGSSFGSRMTSSAFVTVSSVPY